MIKEILYVLPVSALGAAMVIAMYLFVNTDFIVAMIVD